MRLRRETGDFSLKLPADMGEVAVNPIGLSEDDFIGLVITDVNDEGTQRYNTLVYYAGADNSKALHIEFGVLDTISLDSRAVAAPRSFVYNPLNGKTAHLSDLDKIYDSEDSEESGVN